MNEFFRNFWTTLNRFRTSSLLNIIGLAVAFASLYIIVVQINHDLYYNRNIADGERIYRLEFVSQSHAGMFSTSSNRLVPETCIKGLPSVEACGCGNFLAPYRECVVSSKGELKHFKYHVSESSADFVKVFKFSCIQGNAADIAKPRSLAISETVAKETGVTVGDDFYLSTNADNGSRYQIVAIFSDFAPNSDLSYLQIVSNIGDENMDDHNFWGYNYYVKLSPANDAGAVVEQSVRAWHKIMLDMGVPKEVVAKDSLRLTPMAETYYKSDITGGGGSIGKRGTTCTLIAVAVLVVVIAFVNFINFFFALVPVRIRAVNTRKIFGCSLLKLRSMLVFESIGLVVIALAVASVLVLYAQNASFAQLISSPLYFSKNVGIAFFVAGVALLFSLISSLYPAYYITSQPTAMAIKSSFGTSAAGRRIRYVLVSLQFVISIALIICAMFVNLQYHYMMHFDMGFNKELVLAAEIPSKISGQVKSRDAFDSKLLMNANIKEVAWGCGPFVTNHQRMNFGYSTDTSDVFVSFEYYPVSWNFLHFMGIKVAEGRDFAQSDELKPNATYIFNRTAQKAYNLKLESKMVVSQGEKADVVGFCNDFNFMSLQNGIGPYGFIVYGSNSGMVPRYMYLRTTKDANIKNVIDCVKDAVVAMDPSMYRDGVDVKFFDDDLQLNYRKEKKLSSLITLFSVLAIIISLMGVFGLVMFETQYRMKEIALRRVHGASISQILKMFNAKFLKIIVVCFVIAAPISYYLIHSWLDSFAYKMPIYWWVFAIALAIVLIITIATVTARSYSAATSDPAKLVKTE